MNDKLLQRDDIAGNQESRLSLIWYGVVGILFVIPRLNSLGHLLSWDEAWNLCALKSIAGNGSLFIEQYWRHPPLYMNLGLLLKPLSTGFELRMELLSIVLTCAGMFVLMNLASYRYNRNIAVFSGIAYSLLPGAVFYDTWVKRDSAVIFFGMLALFQFVKKRELLAGVCLGLALLSKETAIFYCVAILLLAITGKSFVFRKKQTILCFIVAILFSGWWYLFLSKSGSGFIKFFFGTSIEAKGFSTDWLYYFDKLQPDLGWSGVALMLTGMIALLKRQDEFSPESRFSTSCLWPFFLLAPAYLIITLSKGKPPWANIVLFPALAMLIGIGWWWLSDLLTKWFSPFKSERYSVIIFSVLLMLFLGMHRIGFSYADYYKKNIPEHFEISKAGMQKAELVNANVKDGERLLLMPISYLNGKHLYDPIFFWHLNVSPQLYRGKGFLDLRDFNETVKENNIDWVLLYSKGNGFQQEIFNDYIKDRIDQVHLFEAGALLRLNPS